jgi:SEFIR domain-containing protein
MTDIDLSIDSRARTFVSYSWSSPTHESWVVSLAERLVQDGIDVVLDKWDLKAGHDANVFMEQMVTDTTVTKVLMICDRAYVEKANQRAGGVGTESQIISPQLYENNSAQQSKFAALCTEVGDDGKPYVPVFYKGRIYFDFTQPERVESSYEELLRWLADKPRYLKPKLGALPASISNPDLATTATSSRARRAEDAVRNGLAHAKGALLDYFDGFIAELPNFRIVVKQGEIHDDIVMAKIEAMRPYASEFQSVVATLLRYAPKADLFDLVLSTLERAGTFMFRPEDIQQWNTDDFDAYVVLVHDLFLTTFARVLRGEQFDLARQQVERRYVIKGDDSAGERASRSFEVFCGYPSSLERRGRRLQLNRSSLHADLINGWYKGHELGLPFLIQADFVLWLISRFHNDPQTYMQWHPWTIVYAGYRSSPFEMFARAESKQYFDRIAPLFGTKSASDFQTLVAGIDDGDNALRAGYRPGLAVSMSNSKNLGVSP